MVQPVELPQVQAHSEDRQCHSCDTTRSTNHPVRTEDGVDSQCLYLDRGVDVRVSMKRQTSMIVKCISIYFDNNAGVVVNVKGDVRRS